jgi:hypothetical protein
MTSSVRVRVTQPRFLLVAAAVTAAVAALLVLRRYGGDSLWPELVSGFGASLLAFMLALTWESDRERRRFAQEMEREGRRFEQAAKELEQERATEVRRRFQGVRTELQKNDESIAMLMREFAEALEATRTGTRGMRALHPQLLDRAWNANAPRLAELVADYELIAELGITYGRIEELRWRLRHRTESRSAELDTMTARLVEELRDENRDLLERVDAQIQNPDVQQLGLVHKVSGTVTARAVVSADLSALKVPRTGPHEPE